MQDVAIERSAAVGWPMERHLANGAGWVVRAHFVENLRPACSGERMAIHTQLVARARPGHPAYGRGRLAGDFVMFTDMLLGRLRL
jgi:acyl-CoA thioester hydrolase